MPNLVNPYIFKVAEVPGGIPGIKLWLDASNASSITSSAGRVSQWDDLSGAGNHVSQSIGASKPATGVATINSLNTITFDTGRLELGGPLMGASTDFTFFVVMNYNVLNTNQFIISQYGGGSDPVRTAFLINNQTGNIISFFKAGFFNSGVASSISTNYLFSSSRNGDTVTVESDGVGASGTPYGSSFTISQADFHINYLENNLGNVAEIIAFDRFLNSSEKASVEDYLNVKWAL